MSQTRIEWTERTWNPLTGCDHMSPGCDRCYAEIMAHWLRAMGQANYRNGFALTLQPQMLHIPLDRKKPTQYFVNSMSDLYHKDVPLSYIQDVFAVMHQAPQHIYQILTKRAKRLHRLSPELRWAPHIWQGVSVESQAYTWRIDLLCETGAVIKWLSLEPLVGPLELTLTGIHWVVVGGESGAGARPMHPDWVRAIRDQCQTAGVPFFFKQWGGVRKQATGRVLDGREWNEQPDVRHGIEAPA